MLPVYEYLYKIMIAGIIGATGYAGAELVRLLAGHSKIDTLALASVSHGGERIETIYLNFFGRVPYSLGSPEEVIAASDVVFSALPHGVGENYAKAALERGISFIDLSADFRFGDDEAVYSAWYGRPYVYPELRRSSIYGLPELNRARIKALVGRGPVIIGNPGCYPTAASLGLFPALSGGAAGPGTIIVDAVSGVTGGGRDPSPSFHYPECADSVAPYKVGAHRHTPEINRNAALMAAGLAADGRTEGRDDRRDHGRDDRRVIFTPHLAPMNRGILATMYIPLAEPCPLPAGKGGAAGPPSREITEKAGDLREFYAAFYRDEPFVRVLPAGAVAATARVRQSNFCDISVHLDPAGSTLIVISAIDNMVKGAAGQAIQNMNIILGFDETEGLSAIPASF
jgi:N-acetyl-gamma-glutamyl-phosphate reductase